MMLKTDSVAGGVAEVVEHLPSKHEFNHQYLKKKRFGYQTV
jgi:hypothetical protein